MFEALLYMAPGPGNYENWSGESFEMWRWRRMEKVKWREKVANEVLERLRGKRMFLNNILRRKVIWIDHILRIYILLISKLYNA